ncbi:MAG: HEAT repeat domain-containing protein [Chloroflexi bacterium]|nr:MAG: HEAT repeat domain-containing protein [Chloroflexota bacterium]
MKQDNFSPTDIPMTELLDAFLDEDTPFNPRFLYRLSDLSPEDLQAFINTWQRVSTWRRQTLMEDLEELGEVNTIVNFEAIGRLAIDDQDSRVRAAGLRVLIEYKDESLIPRFLVLLNDDDDPDVRAAAANVLARYVYIGEVEELSENWLHEIEDTLLRVTESDDLPIVRRNALESLGYSSRPEVIPLIQRAYNSNEREWVASSLFAMARSASEEWEKHVLAKINSQHPIIRLEAARAAGELALDAALDPLFELLNDDNQEVRMTTIWSLSQIGGEGVRERLEYIRDSSEDEDEVDAAENALENLEFTEDLENLTLFDIEADDVDSLLQKRESIPDARLGEGNLGADEEEEFFDDDESLEDEYDEGDEGLEFDEDDDDLEDIDDFGLNDYDDVDTDDEYDDEDDDEAA